MTTFLFWNLNKKPLQQTVANLATRHQVDVLLFAECAIQPATILTTLNAGQASDYYYAPSIGCKKIEVYTKFSASFMPAISETDRLTIRHLQLPGLTDILVAAIHFPSKLYWKESDQAFETTVLVDEIRRAEQTVGHARTVLVGDMNMNPFEDGMVGAAGLHAVMSRQVAQGMERIIQGRKYPFFYNPMWGLLGDTSPGPPGTYYRSSAEHVVYFWNMFDQVLVRPGLLELFDTNGLAILQDDGDSSFLADNGMPNTKVTSDHLPLLFKIAL